MSDDSKATEAKPEVNEGGKALRAKPELVVIGDRQVSSTGMWNDNLMMDYLEASSKDRWVTIGELAKVAWHQNTITTKRRARSYLSRIFKTLLIDRGLIMIVDNEGPHGRAKQVKIYNKDRAQDRQALDYKLEELKNRSDRSEQLYETAIALLNSDTRPTESAA